MTHPEFQQLLSNPKLDANLVEKAYRLIHSPNPKNLYYHQSPIEMGLKIALSLSELNGDTDSIVAALLYPSVYCQLVSPEDLETELNPTVFKLVSGVLLIDNIHRAYGQKSNEHKLEQAQILRKMLLAIVGDLRVVLIKLAERLAVLESLRHMTTQEQESIAEEVMNIYAPLANRLGLGQLKWQLEDWSFRYLNREAYEDIFKALKMRHDERENFVQEMINKLNVLIRSTHIKTVEISGRAKHIYSIHRKLVKKLITMDQIYDAIAVRITVPTLQDCYAVLGIVHATWPHVPQEFDDYIAHPKPNGYRSIHTAIIGPQDRHMEIQIRTFEMHKEAELGIAAHWLYKEGSEEGQYENKINLLRSVLDWQKNISLLDDHVYIFTPNGDLVDLENGSTPLDFAYHIHTDLGHSCRGAKINGALVPLTYALKTGDRVNIVTTKNGHPSRDWLLPNSGYLQTHRAKQKVSAWFKRQRLAEHIEQGEEVWEKTAHLKGINKQELAKAAKQLNFKTVEGLMAALGSGDLKCSTILNALDIEHPESEPHKAGTQIDEIKISTPKTPEQSSIIIEGVGNLYTQLARCCKPIPGDSVIGYITRDRGVTIHQEHCQNIMHAIHQRPERALSVSWGLKLSQRYAIDILIEAFDKPGITREISNLIANEKLVLLNFKMRTDKSSNRNFIDLTVELENLNRFQDLLNQLKHLPDVLMVRRR